MKKHNEELFQIGEVAKILGVTRKAILGFEEMGLLTPAVKDEESGYRYYSADNMTQIRSIRSLQELGLSLKEVREYYYDTDNLDRHLARLYELRATLDRNIQMLQVRSAKRGDLTVHRTTLPQQVCFCRQYPCRDTAEAANCLRDTYIAAARTGKMSMLARMFTMRMTQDPDELDLMCCIPVEESFAGTERMEFCETPALCIYYRGPYEGTADAIRALAAYIRENGIETTGPFRSIYLEGPPNRGENSGDYITQIAVPIRA
ncbi:MAG: MerR family transcriptional regulator [Ruminococcaceae bacterium]|nr:MerR family transcriptional regulator [Oscillospiraceae bacterium]